jgi:hypothetical protein
MAYSSDMAGYSGKPLHEKLGMKPGYAISILNAPANQSDFLQIPEGVELSEDNDRDLILAFYTEAADLQRAFPALILATKTNGAIWISWPKKASGMKTDLNENLVRDIGLAAGVVDVKVCAVDDTWSGLKFVRRLKDR